MLAVIVPGLAGAFFFLFWVWAVLDVIAMDSVLMRSLPKSTWVFLVLFVPPIGAVAWIVLGRPENAGFSGNSVRRSPSQRQSYYNSSQRVRGPEDDPNWQVPSSSRNRPATPPSATPADTAASDSLAARERKLLEREAELAKREAALAETADEGIPIQDPSESSDTDKPEDD